MNRLVGAWAASLLVVVACSSNESGPGSPSGTTSTAVGAGGASTATGASSSTGAASSSGTGGGTSGGAGGVGTGGGGGTGGTATTTGGTGGAASNACNDCADAAGCQTELQNCQADATCSAWLDCTHKCTKADFTKSCFDACAAANPSNLSFSVIECVCGACQNVCAPACP